MNNTTQLIQQLETIITEQNFPGVISIAARGTTVFEQAYGYANRSDRIENQVNTRFGIASGTKTFTALAIGKLIQEGKLTLDAKALECVSMPIPNVSADVTIRHLLTHTSGIGDYYDEDEVNNFEEFFTAIPWYALKGPKDYLPLFTKPMKFMPGERFSYCNGGYILLVEFDLYIVGPDGEYVTCCIIWFDDVNKLGFFEPVCTHPDFRRRGFGREVMLEGIRRVAALGATKAYVGSSQQFYKSIGCEMKYATYHWIKTF